MHGGSTPTGMSLPQFKHGKYSKAVMQPEMRAHAEVLLANPAFLSNREELAIHDAITMRLLEEVTTGLSYGIFEKQAKEKQAMLVSRAKATPQGNSEAAFHLNNLLELVDRGEELRLLLDQLARHMLSRIKYTEAEGKMLERHQASVRADTFYASMAQLGDAIFECVSDYKEQNALYGRLQAIMGPGAGHRVAQD